jgi:HAD superfamily hydrolase (TIGR01509 family)
MNTPWIPPAGTQGLIFDCDGTLADTMPVHYRAWVQMLSRHGITFTETRFYQLGGIPTEKIIRILSEESGVAVPEIPPLIWEKEGLFLDQIHHVKAIEPVAYVARIHHRQLPMAVASGGYRKVVEKTLQCVGVSHLFETVVCAEDTERHKPDPDVFWEAARRLGVNAGRCVVFEDTDVGLEAARRAGMFGVDIRSWL